MNHWLLFLLVADSLHQFAHMQQQQLQDAMVARQAAGGTGRLWSMHSRTEDTTPWPDWQLQHWSPSGTLHVCAEAAVIVRLVWQKCCNCQICCFGQKWEHCRTEEMPLARPRCCNSCEHRNGERNHHLKGFVAVIIVPLQLVLLLLLPVLVRCTGSVASAYALLQLDAHPRQQLQHA